MFGWQSLVGISGLITKLISQRAKFSDHALHDDLRIHRVHVSQKNEDS